MPAIQNVFSNQVQRGSTWQRPQLSIDQMAEMARTSVDKAGSIHVTPRSIRHARTPMIITTRNWMPNKVIQLFVNPSDMRWSLPRRGTVVKTLGGTVRNVWRNRYRGTYYDEGTVGITFQTGNIMPSAAYDVSELQTVADISAAVGGPRVPPGLQDFYLFMELLDQPMLIGPAENYHYIFHHSRVFPNIQLIGYFAEDSFTFSEVATDGNRLQWEATFQIYRTSPRFQRAGHMTKTYQNFVKSSAQDEQLGADNVSRYIYNEGIGKTKKSAPAGKPKVKSASAGAASGSLSVTSVASSTSKKKAIADAAKRFETNNSELLTTMRGG